MSLVTPLSLLLFFRLKYPICLQPFVSIHVSSTRLEDVSRDMHYLSSCSITLLLNLLVSCYSAWKKLHMEEALKTKVVINEREIVRMPLSVYNCPWGVPTLVSLLLVVTRVTQVTLSDSSFPLRWWQDSPFIALMEFFKVRDTWLRNRRRNEFWQTDTSTWVVRLLLYWQTVNQEATESDSLIHWLNIN